MPHISLTTFIGFIVASGSSRITRIKEAKQFYEDKTPFEQRSYWLQLRHAAVGCFESNGNRTLLRDCIDACADARKLASYQANVAGLIKWMGRRQFTWLGVRPQIWRANGLEVNVNPELGVSVNGKPHIIKLHFKSEPLTKRAIDPMLHLLDVTHGSQGGVGILDVQRSRLLTPTRLIPGIDALLQGEAAAFVHMWNSI